MDTQSGNGNGGGSASGGSGGGSGGSASGGAMREVLRRYLNNQREAVLWKLEGLSERDARLPQTATGSNVLGIVKHLAAVELDYIALSFDRPHGLALELMGDDAEPNADMF
ncbi:MAG: DUF664 domain-containing protein, partial [bacterium]|nr:DUF664 domain-containing protein [bacterium]